MYIDESVSQTSNEYHQNNKSQTPYRRNNSGDSRNSLNSVKLRLARNKVTHTTSRADSRTTQQEDRHSCSSVESLDRIHTFSLKNSVQQPSLLKVEPKSV